MAQYKYNLNEDIRCNSNPDLKWYEAKIVGRKMGANEQPHYLIHYKGWRKEWDEWVPEGFRLSRESRNVLEERLKREVAQIKEMDEKQKFKSTDTVHLLPLSIEIQESLVAQFQMICHRPMLLVDLPKPDALTVNGLCSEFTAIRRREIEETNKTNAEEETLYLEQTVASIQFYFNQFLAINILFEAERAQKETLEKQWVSRRGTVDGDAAPQIDFCDLYGAEHLFRLLFHLPTIYNNVNWDHPMQTAKIANYVGEFQGFLTKNIKRIAADFDLNENMNECGLLGRDCGLR